MTLSGQYVWRVMRPDNGTRPLTIAHVATIRVVPRFMKSLNIIRTRIVCARAVQIRIPPPATPSITNAHSLGYVMSFHMLSRIHVKNVHMAKVVSAAKRLRAMTHSVQKSLAR